MRIIDFGCITNDSPVARGCRPGGTGSWGRFILRFEVELDPLFLLLSLKSIRHHSWQVVWLLYVLSEDIQMSPEPCSASLSLCHRSLNPQHSMKKIFVNRQNYSLAILFGNACTLLSCIYLCDVVEFHHPSYSLQNQILQWRQLLTCAVKQWVVYRTERQTDTHTHTHFLLNICRKYCSTTITWRQLWIHWILTYSVTVLLYFTAALLISSTKSYITSPLTVIYFNDSKQHSASVEPTASRLQRGSVLMAASVAPTANRPQLPLTYISLCLWKWTYIV